MKNWTNIWKILGEHKLDINSQISGFSECTICGQFLIDAYIGLCGCNYCKRCIESWMDLGNQFCPGRVNSCISEESLSINRNVFKDHGSDIRLLAFEIKCPLDSCNHRCKISQLDLHFEVCEKSMMECPFNEIGCDFKSINKNVLIEHLHNEVEFHSKYWIKYLTDNKSKKSTLDSDLNGIVTENSCNDMIYSIELKFNQLTFKKEDHTKKDQTDLEDLRNHIQGLETKYRDLENVVEKIWENWNNEISNLWTNNMIQEKEISKLKTLSNSISEQNSSSEIITCPKLAEMLENNSYWQFSIHWNTKEMFPIRSPPFYSADKKHQIVLFIFPCGCFFDCFQKNGVCFQFVIGKTPSPSIKWEFKGIIKITLTNKDLPAESFIVTRSCEFNETLNRQIFHFAKSFKHFYQNFKIPNSVLINCTIELVK